MNIFNQLADEYDRSSFNKQETPIINCDIFAVWSPNQEMKLAWDVLGMLFILIQMLLIPLLISFELEYDVGFQAFIDIMDYYFLIDILVQFNTGFYYLGKLQMKRIAIVVNYMKMWFWIDIISSLPYDRFTDSGNVQAIKFLRFFKFMKVLKMLRAIKLKQLIVKIQEYIDPSLQTVLQLFKLSFIIVCLAHWSACLFNLVTDIQYDYLTAFYFSITTMITVGYGDIHPYGFQEQLYTIFAMILASGVFGYSMNSMVCIFSYEDPDTQMLLERQAQVTKYVKLKKCPQQLQDRINDYIEWQMDNESNARSQLILKDLSSELQNSVISHINFQILKLLPITIKQVIQMDEQILMPDQELTGRNSIYYLKSGVIAFSAGNSVIGLANKWFGELAFFADLPRSAGMTVLVTASIIKIDRDEFFKYLNQEQIEQFHMLKNKLESGNLEDLDLICFGCGQQGHYAKYCKKFHYMTGTAVKQIIQRPKGQKKRRVYGMKVIEYFDIMNQRKRKQIIEEEEAIVTSFNIDKWIHYSYFDIDWNLNTIISRYNIKSRLRQCIRQVIRRLKFHSKKRLLKLQGGRTRHIC